MWLRTGLLVLAVALTGGCAGSVPQHAGQDVRRPAPAQVRVTPTAPAPSVKARLGFVFPVRGTTSYSPAHHDYPATDIFAACGAPVRAPVAGRVGELSRRDRWHPGADDPALRGGLSWALVDAEGVRYYGSHLRALADRLRVGARVRAGARLGRVGDTGNAAGTPCHLHFGISPDCGRTGDWWVRRGVVAPYPFLRAWERGRDRSPQVRVARWLRRHGCLPPGAQGPPSAGPPR